MNTSMVRRQIFVKWENMYWLDTSSQRFTRLLSAVPIFLQDIALHQTWDHFFVIFWIVMMIENTHNLISSDTKFYNVLCTNKFLNKQCLPEDEVLKQYSLCGRIQRSIYASIELRFPRPINSNRISFKFNSNNYFRNKV